MKIDRISCLPDELISLILSFLSTKDAVATCVLSKRWRSLWTLVPVVNFSSSSSEETESFLSFFGEKVRTLGRSLDVVRLQGNFGNHIGDLVRETIAREVRELDFSMTSGSPIVLCNGNLTSKTLVSLRLKKLSFDHPLSVHLPCLKILHLQEVGDVSEESINQLISCCPAVEDILVSKYSRRQLLKLPSSLLTSQILVSLNLGYGTTFDFPSPIHLPRLKILHLQLDNYVNHEFVTQFLSGCTLLEDVFLSKIDGEPIELPDYLFFSTTLVSLKLGGRISFHFPHSIYLPRLRILHIYSVDILDDKFLASFLSGCPLLEDMILENHRIKPIKSPYNLFLSKTLVSLKLSGRISLLVPPIVHLPCLRILHLASVTFLLDRSLGDLLSGCPVLEEIYLSDLQTTNEESSSVCIPKLEHLLVGLMSTHPLLYKLNITALALKHLRVFCGYSDGEIAWDVPNLQEAYIFFYHKIPGKLFSTVRNTKVLKLHHHDFGYNSPPLSMDLIPKFQHLEHLEIDNLVSLLSFLPEILENSANLQKLIIYGKRACRDVAWSAPQNVSYCLQHSLKSFSIDCFEGLDNETQMVNYILTNGQVLETIRIRFFIPAADQKLRAQEKLLATPRGSSKSQLEFITSYEQLW